MKKIKAFSEPIHVSRPFLPPLSEYTYELMKIWDVYHLTNVGAFHQKFEIELKKYLDVSFNSLFVNGHLALDIAIKALNLTGEVITTPFTFASTTHAIHMNGLKPIFCDINKNDYNIDVTKIEELITEQTSAIIPVHVFGRPCNVSTIDNIASRYNLKVIYDAAHAFGVKINQKGIGIFGDISMFSLHATKVFHSIEGGLLSYSDGDLKERLTQYRNFGIAGPETIKIAGLNAKMNEFQAAMGLLNLKYIEKGIEKRKALTILYREKLMTIPGIRYVEEKSGIRYNYSYFSIEVDASIYGINRDDLYTQLINYNVYTRKYFYPLTSELECYNGLFDVTLTPIAKNVSKNILILPLYSDLQFEDVEKICEIIKSIYLDNI